MNTKIVCTIGPASEAVDNLLEMARAGMSLCRLNFSHGTYEHMSMLIANIQQVRKDLGVELPIIQDLQGPKIRVKTVKGKVVLKPGDEVIVGRQFTIDHPIHESIKKRHRILIQDGLIELKVLRVEGKHIICNVVNGGEVLLHKGVNLPDTKLKLTSLTAKDIKDLKWGLKRGVDFVALSFVRSAEDIKEGRAAIKKYLPKSYDSPAIISKIERPEAIKNMREIMEQSDIVMVARGDLGVEMPDFEVPVLQKKIIREARRHKKPVIVATQMLESMVNNPRPTRAEVSDVANAVEDGAWGVMLSEETAFGKYPVETVQEMAKIVKYTEKNNKI